MPEARLRCHQVAHYLSALADGELAEPLRARVAAHVAECATCTARLADYRRVDSLLAGLPPTRPSARVYENIQLTIQAQADPQAVRESLTGSPRTDVLRRRLAAVRAPSRTATPLPERPAAGGRHALAGALPALAAVLVIGLALFGFARARQSSTPPPTLQGTPALSASVLQQTSAQVGAMSKQLGFSPVLPRYLPAGARLAAVSATPLRTTGAISGTYLDVTWTFATGIVCRVHLREAPTALGWPGYSSASADAVLSWQLPGSPPWRPLDSLSGSQQPAVGQARADFSIAVDVQPCGLADPQQSDIAVLRLVSLSIDAPYLPMGLIPNNGTGRVLHWIAAVVGRGGQTIYSQEVYRSADGSEQALFIREGTTLVAETIIRGQQALQLDLTRGRYFAGAASAVGGPAAPPSFATMRLFYSANTLANQGYLWNLGTGQYGSKRVLVFALVDGPSPATAYVDPTSDEVIAVSVTLGSALQPGGPSAEPWFAATPCGSYTLIEYLAQAPTGIFDLTPRHGYAQSAAPLSPPTCPAGG